MHPSLTRPRFVHRTSNLIALLRNVKLEEEKELLSFKTLKRADKEEENASLSDKEEEEEEEEEEFVSWLAGALSPAYHKGIHQG